MMDWNWGENFQRITYEEYIEKLNVAYPFDPQGWEMIVDYYSPFGVTQLTTEIKCCKCGAVGEGGIHLGQTVIEKKKVKKYLLRNVCYKCAIEMSINPNETVCHMLSMLDKEQSTILNNSIWSISTRGTIYTNIYGVFFSAGEYVKNKGSFWALCNDNFFQRKFRSLEDAQRTALKKCLPIIPLHRNKIESLFDTESIAPKSKEQIKYEENDLLGWPK